jgi:hypothetical protein
MLENGLFFRDEAFKGGKLEFLAKKTDELVIPEVAGGMLCGRTYADIEAHLKKLGYTHIHQK